MDLIRAQYENQTYYWFLKSDLFSPETRIENSKYIVDFDNRLIVDHNLQKKFFNMTNNLLELQLSSFWITFWPRR
jgi:hypothetical protein